MNLNRNLRVVLVFAGAILGTTSLRAEAPKVRVQTVKSKQATVGGSIQILSVKPSDEKPLRVGDKVTFIVKVDYELKEPKGKVSLLIQKPATAADKADPTKAILLTTTKDITKGRRTVEFKETIQIPNVETLSLFVPLWIEGVSETQVVDSRVFMVKK